MNATKMTIVTSGRFSAKPIVSGGSEIKIDLTPAYSGDLICPRAAYASTMANAMIWHARVGNKICARAASSCFALSARIVLALLLALILSDSVHAAARSTRVRIKNNTEYTMTFVGLTATHGIISGQPTTQITAGTVGELFAESNGFMTGTEGWVKYRLEGFPGEAKFHWDNPFLGSNSADGLGPDGYAVDYIGNTSNHTTIFFSLHRRDDPKPVCDATWVLDHLGTHAEDELDGFDKSIGEVTTIFKKAGIGGWVKTGCDAKASGWLVRDAQYSTDGFWTIDIKLDSMSVAGVESTGTRGRFVRIEVEPNVEVHGAIGEGLEQGHFIHFGGPVLIDTHHNETLIEVHPQASRVIAPHSECNGRTCCDPGPDGRCINCKPAGGSCQMRP